MVQQVALQRDPQCPGQNPWGFRFRCLFSGLAHPLLSVLLRPPSAGCWPFALHCVCRSNGILCCQCCDLHCRLPALLLFSCTFWAKQNAQNGVHSWPWPWPSCLGLPHCVWRGICLFSLGRYFWNQQQHQHGNETKRNVPPARLHFPGLAACHQLPVAYLAIHWGK